MNETRDQYVKRIQNSRLDDRVKDLLIETGPLGDCIEEGPEFEDINKWYIFEEGDLILKNSDGLLLIFPKYDLIRLVSEHKGHYKIYGEWRFQEYIDESK